MPLPLRGQVEVTVRVEAMEAALEVEVKLGLPVEVGAEADWLGEPGYTLCFELQL